MSEEEKDNKVASEGEKAPDAGKSPAGTPSSGSPKKSSSKSVEETQPIEADETEDNEEGDPVDKYPLICSQRFALCILVFMGYFIEYCLRINLSSAILCMCGHNGKNDTTENVTTDAFETTTSKPEEEFEFDWDNKVQSSVLGAFFYGYIVTQVISGLAADKFGPKPVIMITMALASGVTLLTPVAARAHYGVLIGLRVLLGALEGAYLPCISALWAHWAPPAERSVLIALGFTGTQLGSIFSLATSSEVCSGIGWEWVFYIHGAMGIIWVIIWQIMAASTPEKSKWVKPAEKEYIEYTLLGSGQSKKKESILKMPWCKIVKSTACWAVWLAHTGANFGNYLVLTCLPTFMKDVLDFDLHSAGPAAAVPYIALLITGNIAGLVADCLIKRHILSVKNTRKVMNTIGLMGWAVVFSVTTFMKDKWVATGLLGLGQGLLGFHVAGVFVNVVDIAPKYSGLIFGISNMIATIPGFLSTGFVGIIVTAKDKEPFVKSDLVSQWQIVFFLCTGLVMLCWLFNLIFCQGEVQSWAKSAKEKAEKDSGDGTEQTQEQE